MKNCKASYLNYVTSARLSIFFSDLLDKTWKGRFTNSSLNLISVFKSPWKYLKEPDVFGIEIVTCLRTNYLCYTREWGNRRKHSSRVLKKQTCTLELYISNTNYTFVFEKYNFFMTLIEATEASWHKLSILTTTAWNLQSVRNTLPQGCH